MSIRQFESAITSEARRFFHNSKIRVKDLQEWSTAPIEPREDEVVARLPLNGVFVAFKKQIDKRPQAA
jgi:hypothetical protein